jgi:nicotinamidase-related amidase
MLTTAYAADPSDTAFVFIEFQNEFTTPGGKLYEAVKGTMDQYGTIRKRQKVMNYARNAGCTIIHVPIEFEKGHKEINGEFGILANVKAGEAFTANTWNSEICDVDETPVFRFSRQGQDWTLWLSLHQS